MNKFYLCVLFSLIYFSVSAQAPQGINYQAVARDAGGNPIATQTVAIEFKIHQTTAGGTVVYDETHSKTTNQFGLFTAIIGQGSVVTGTFSTIAWSSDIYFLEVIVNSNNMGTTQLMSVPYSLHSNTAGNGLPTGTSGQTLRHNGTNWIANTFLKNNGSQVTIGELSPSTARFYIDGTDDLFAIRTPSDAGRSLNIDYYNSAFAITNNGVNGIVFYSDQPHSPATEAMRILNGSGNVGIGTSTPGAKLEVGGQIKITGGTPGANKVLTSDAIGLATWTTLSASSFGGWATTGGNTLTGTLPATPNEWIGSSNAADLIFRTSSIERMRISSTGVASIVGLSTAGVVHNSAAGLLSTSLIVNGDIAASTIDLTTKVTGILPIANGGTSFSTYASGDLIYASAANTLSKLAIGANGQVLTLSGGLPSWQTAAAGTVTNVSVVTANGLAGTVATPSSTPAITLSTTVTGMLKGNGTAISAATAGTDYITGVTGTAPVVSSGGATPAISMAAANGGTNGYLSSADWTTFNSKGNGTVTTFTAGNLSPLFNSSVATPGTTPALTFSQINQNANLVFAGPSSGGAAAPTFRALVAADLPALGGSYIQNGTALQSNANFNIQSAALGSVGGIIKGFAGQTADLQQWQNSGGTKLVVVDANGNVGIGISAPTTFLHVEPAAPGAIDLIKSKTTGTGIAGYFEINNPASTQRAVYAISNGSGATIQGFNTGTSGRAANFNITDATNANSVVYATTSGTGSAGAFWITNSANNSDAVFATNQGTGSAGYFEIVNAANNADAIYGETNGTGRAVYGYNSGTGKAGSFQINNAVSAASALYATTNGTGLAGEFAGKIKINDGTASAGKVLTATDAVGNAIWAAAGAALPGGTVGQTLRHDGTNWVANSVIYNDGTYVGIGVVPSGSYKLQVNGKLKSTGIDETSDMRYKKNISTIDNALNKVMSLRGVNYNWRTDEFKEKNFDTAPQIGLIAQEVEKIIPQVVTTDKDGFKSVEYSKLVALLIEAMKEQQKKIDLLTAENKDLKKNSAATTEEMKTLKADVKTLKDALDILLKETVSLKEEKK